MSLASDVMGGAMSSAAERRGVMLRWNVLIAGARVCQESRDEKEPGGVTDDLRERLKKCGRGRSRPERPIARRRKRQRLARSGRSWRHVGVGRVRVRDA